MFYCHNGKSTVTGESIREYVLVWGPQFFFWLERSQGTTCADCPNLSLVLDFLDEREAEAGQIFGAAKDMNFPDGDAWKC